MGICPLFTFPYIYNRYMHKISKILVSVLLCSIFLGAVTDLFSFSGQDKRVRHAGGALSEREISLIRNSSPVMWVYQVSDPYQESVLRRPASEFDIAEVGSENVAILSSKMLSTVNAPQYGGVGIAGPQVGISRRIIAVCRLDKPGEPFEVYPNVKLDSLWGPVEKGREGCLSIPPYIGNVPRYKHAIVSYIDAKTLKVKRDTVSDYVARIFQHECDHLEGILFTDRVDTLNVDKSWEAEWKAFTDTAKVITGPVTF